MNKYEFLGELQKRLSILDQEECSKFITYYDEIIEDYKENGISEADAIKKIGSPKTIADEILSEQDAVDLKIPTVKSKLINYLLLILGFPLWGSLLLAAVMLVLSAYLVIWCIPFVTGTCAFAFLLAAIVSLAGAPFVMANDVFAAGIVQFGCGVASIGIAILSAYATVFLVKKFYAVTKSFTLKLIGAFKKKVVIL